jgi:hypothetical protein
MAKPSVKITAPVAYHGFILRPRSDGGMDLIDPSTHRWAAFPTQRFAKWSATFMTNITAQFNEEAPLKKLPVVKVDQV